MNLKHNQKIVLVIGLFLISVIGLFPPFVSNVDVLDNATNDVRPAYTEPGGRHFVFAPAKPMISQKNLIITSEIDYSRLIIEWLAISFLTASVVGLMTVLNPPKMSFQEGDGAQSRAA